MRISSQLDKLKEKFKSEKKHKENHLIFPTEALQIESSGKIKDNEKQKHKFLDDLDMFKNLLFSKYDMLIAYRDRYLIFCFIPRY